MLPRQHFYKGALGQKFQFFIKKGLFLLQNVFISDFWLEFEISVSELNPVPNFSSTGQKIRELEFWPGMIPKMSWLRHTYLLAMTSAKFLWLLRDFVPEYHHAKIGCNWTINKGETEGGGAKCAPANIVPKDPSLIALSIAEIKQSHCLMRSTFGKLKTNRKLSSSPWKFSSY